LIPLEKLIFQSNQELESQAAELKIQSDELSEQNIELGRQQLQVEEANRLKSEFLSNMSHELRTPLNSIMALSRILVRRTKDILSNEESEFLEIIERNGKQLLALINDILDLSKIEAGRVELDNETFSVKAVANRIVESVVQIAAEKNVKIHQEFADDLPDIESDKSRIQQILPNQLDGSIEVIKQKGTKFIIHFSIKD